MNEGRAKNASLDYGGVENACGGKWKNSMLKLGGKMFEMDVETVEKIQNRPVEQFSTKLADFM